MTLEEMQKALGEANLAKQTEVTALQEQFKSLQAEKESNAQEVEALKSQLKAAEDAVKDLGVQMKSLENTQPASPKEIAEFLKSEDGKKAIEQLQSKGYPSEFSLKTAGAMTVGGNVLPVGTGGILASLMGANGEIFLINRTTIDNILDYVTVLSTDMAQITYVEEVAKDGSVGTISEGDAITLNDWQYQEKKSTAIKKAGMIKVSEEMLGDISYMASSLTQVLNEKYVPAKGNDIVTDMLSKATAFANTTLLYPTLAAPTAFDAINAMAAQSALSGFAPDAVVMHPTDVYALRSIKDTGGQPVLGFFADGKTPYLTNGLSIVMHKGQTKGTALVGTLKNYKVYDYDLRLELGYDADDFSKDLRSIKVAGRYHRILPANQNNLTKGVLATVITALTTPAPAPEGGA